ncbi:hypothetical protein CsSME_00026824 [Camellia sinensis var. sinensis]
MQFTVVGDACSSFVRYNTSQSSEKPKSYFQFHFKDFCLPLIRHCNVSNRADSTKIGKKGRDLLRGFSLNYQRWQKNLGSFIENTNTTMVEIAHRIGYSHDLSQQRRLVNAELLKLPMSNTQKLMPTSMIVKNEDKVDLFFSLDENDKMEWVSLLLKGHI